MSKSPHKAHSPPPVVAVINSSPDTIELLRHALQPAGFVTVSAMTYDLRDNRVNWAGFLKHHQPRVVVYDIAPPYDANWDLFLHLSRVDGAGRLPFVVTSTNAPLVRKLAGRHRQVFEIVGKPLDLGLIVNAVKEAAADRLL